MCVQVTDDAPAPTTMSGFAIVSIRILDVNEVPIITPLFLSVTENSAPGTFCLSAVGAVGAPGSDVDAGDVIRWGSRLSVAHVVVCEHWLGGAPTCSFASARLCYNRGQKPPRCIALACADTRADIV